MTLHYILGTAGHIDHGKTALIRALTGTDTDRLPEEKRRGITIELGFTRLDLDGAQLGIVDVPGHERFVRNMLAGATGIDLALLVVAADDSVMPQTREHLEILRLLNLHAGLIALTKCDLVAPEWIDLVESEVGELVQGTFLERAPIVRTSVTTGMGLDALRAALEQVVADYTAIRQSDGAHAPDPDQFPAPFRMAIDRSFTLAGHGTIVTGSILSGSVQVGETLAVEPGGISVRIRALQNHYESTERVHRGQHSAINLAGLHHGSIRRGQELATANYLQPSRLLTVHLELLATARRPLKNRSRVQLHLGTDHVTAIVSLLTAPESNHALPPGASALAQLQLSAPVVGTWRQPFVIRWPSPMETIGGGTLVQPCAERIRPRDSQSIAMAEQLRADDDAARIAAAYYFHGWTPPEPLALFRDTGCPHPEPVMQALQDAGILIELQEPRGGRQRIHIETLHALEHQIAKTLASLHDAEPLRRSFDPAQVLHSMHAPDAANRFWTAVAGHGSARGILVVDPSTGQIALPGKGPQLSRGEQQLFESMVERIHAAGVMPPSIDELTKSAPRNRNVIPKLLELAEADGLLVQIEKQMFVHTETLDRVKQELRAALIERKSMTLSEIRSLLATSRKYAVPICEYLDRIGFTQRQADNRILND